MTGPCLCGAPDCRRCHPENYRGKLYIGDLTDDEIEEALDRADADAEARGDLQRDEREERQT